MPAAVEARSVELRRAHPGWGPAGCAIELGRDGVDPVPCRCGDLSGAGPAGPDRAAAAGGAGCGTYKRWERGRPMELWQLDVVGGVLLADGTECKVVTGDR